MPGLHLVPLWCLKQGRTEAVEMICGTGAWQPAAATLIQKGSPACPPSAAAQGILPPAHHAPAAQNEQEGGLCRCGVPQVRQRLPVIRAKELLCMGMLISAEGSHLRLLKLRYTWACRCLLNAGVLAGKTPGFAICAHSMRSLRSSFQFPSVKTGRAV
jgi:hypothetical protein